MGNVRRVLVPAVWSRFGPPLYATPGSAGADLKAKLEGRGYAILWPFTRRLIPTGLRIALPEGYQAEVRPRSGLSLRKGLIAVQGTIDSDYRGEVGVILENRSWVPRVILAGERIAQLVVTRYTRADFIIGHLDTTERGKGGFGSTGTR